MTDAFERNHRILEMMTRLFCGDLEPLNELKELYTVTDFRLWCSLIDVAVCRAKNTKNGIEEVA